MAAASPLTTFRGLDGTRRFLVLGLAAAAIVGVWLASRWATAATFVPLFRDLELAEVATLQDALGKSAVSYRLGAGGTEILVPAADVARARVALARDGLPVTGRPGLELFDKPAWGMTDFTQRVTYQRALEGELARTIGRLRGVRRAEVHLVLPASSPLRRLERPASASVVLGLSSAALNPETIQGITYIVSNSVEQLSAENVAVMDDQGHVLSVPGGASSVAGLSTRQLDIRRSVERHLADKIETLVATVVGSGRVQAQVSAQLNFDQVDRTIEAFDPDGQVLQSEQRSEPGAGAQPAGSQSVTSNTYQNSRKLEKIVGAVGNVTRLTVAVLVDDSSLAGRGAAAPGVDRLETMVRDAVGLDPARGDRITVVAVPFGPAAVVAGPASEDPGPPAGRDVIGLMERLAPPVLGLVGIGGVVLLALRALRGGRGAAAGALPQLDRDEPLSAPAARAKEVALLRGRLEAESAERPEAAVNVLRAWLAQS